MQVTVIPIVIGVLEQSTKGWKEDFKSWKSEDESRLSRQQYCRNRLEYWKESWRAEETYCYSDSSEIPPANAGVKKTHQQ